MNQHGLTAGFDEVGRGALAGPLVVAGVVIDDRWNLMSLDSKSHNSARRAELYKLILSECRYCSVVWVSSSEIDKYGLGQSLKYAFNKAAKGLSGWDQAVVDGSANYLSEFPNTQAQVKADANLPAVGAASIIAKHLRDIYMQQLAIAADSYGWETNVGYGTAAHLSSMRQFGLHEQHRRSFKPVGDLT